MSFIRPNDRKGVSEHMYVRPARSSGFSDPEEVAPDDEEAAWWDDQQQAELARPEPQDAAPHAPVRQWQQVWTHDQILDLDDLASYLDYVWEVTRED